MTTALIDGDMVIHMACAANQISGDFGDGLGETELYDVGSATTGAIRMIRNWTQGAGCKTEKVCLSEGHNFRKIIFPGYKANREGIEKPKAFYAVREVIEAEYDVLSIEGLEADDVMGIWGSTDPQRFVVVSRDKDMMTIPGRIYNPDHQGKPVLVRRGVADQIWMKQTMTGDTVDGYSGIPGVGEVAAQEILTSPFRWIKETSTFKRGPRKGQLKESWKKGPRCSLWEAMISRASKAGMSVEELVTMARVARILRSGEFDEDRRVVKLWSPGGGHEELAI